MPRSGKGAAPTPAAVPAAAAGAGKGSGGARSGKKRGKSGGGGGATAAAAGASSPTRGRGDVTGLHDVWNPSKAQSVMLLQRGVHIRRGAWAAAEIETLRGNMDAARRRHKTDGLEALAHALPRKSAESSEFYRALAEGLERPLQAVYRRFLREVAEERGDKGAPYSDADVARLRELHELHGNNYIKIGELMGRTADSVRDRLRASKGAKAPNKWTKEEEARLAEVVPRITGRPPTDLIQTGVPWEAVAAEMAPRAPHQCMFKWSSKVGWRTCASARGADAAWSKSADEALLAHAPAPGSRDEADIDWNHLAETFSGPIRTGYALRLRWRRLVTRQGGAAGGSGKRDGKAHKTPAVVDSDLDDDVDGEDDDGDDDDGDGDGSGEAGSGGKGTKGGSSGAAAGAGSAAIAAADGAAAAAGGAGAASATSASAQAAAAAAAAASSPEPDADLKALEKKVKKKLKKTLGRKPTAAELSAAVEKKRRRVRAGAHDGAAAAAAAALLAPSLSPERQAAKAAKDRKKKRRHEESDGSGGAGSANGGAAAGAAEKASSSKKKKKRKKDAADESKQRKVKAARTS